MLQVIKIQSSYYVLLKKKARKIHRTSVYLFCHIMFFFGGGGGDFFFLFPFVGFFVETRVSMETVTSHSG